MAHCQSEPAAERFYNILLQSEEPTAGGRGDRKGASVADEGKRRAVPTVFIDNERVRVTEWRFAAGAATGWHRHEMDYVVVPMGDGVLELVEPGGERRRVELQGWACRTFARPGSSMT